MPSCHLQQYMLAIKGFAIPKEKQSATAEFTSITPFAPPSAGFKGFAIPKEKQSATAEFTYEGTQYSITHGSVVIAAITSCTNTSNPSVMLGAGLVAQGRGPGRRGQRSARPPTNRSASIGIHLTNRPIAVLQQEYELRVAACVLSSRGSELLGVRIAGSAWLDSGSEIRLCPRALAKGLKVQPYIKSSLAPGSGVVTLYLKESGLEDALTQLGFSTVSPPCGESYPHESL
eukprot:2302604-Pyramimonas_sp.AAC.2